MRYVKVNFTSTMDAGNSGMQSHEKGYYYKDELTTKLAKYDTVIVPTKYGLALATVVAIGIKESDFPYYVNDDNIQSVAEKVKSKSMDNINRLKRADEIKKKLDKEIKKVDEVQKYKMYAELSPEVATLIKELEDLKA